MHMQTRRPCLAALLVLVTWGCGDAPRPVDDAGGRRTQLPPGHPPTGGDAPTQARPVALGFAGKAILKGELASAEQGALMVSAFPPGSRMPILTTKIALDDARVRRTEQGERELGFQLDSASSMIPGEVAEGVEVEIEVRFDRDGYVETKEGDVAARVKARPGARDLVLVLPPND